MQDNTGIYNGWMGGCIIHVTALLHTFLKMWFVNHLLSFVYHLMGQFICPEAKSRRGFYYKIFKCMLPRFKLNK